MAEMDTIDQELLERIQRDLRQVPDEAYNTDALGATIYLYFLLKNKIASAELDRLIDWANDWIDNVLNKQLFSRFVDRELASALFGFYTLKLHSKLKTRVEPRVINDLLNRFGEDNAFFSNLTYTIMILLSVYDYRDRITLFKATLNWVKEQIDNGRIFNDAKNLVFASSLFEKSDPERNQKLTHLALRRFHDQSIPFSEQIYFSWVLWTNKVQFDKKDVPGIRDFVGATLNNMRPILKREEQKNDDLELRYGADDNRVSKILLGVYLDLLRSYNSKTIRVDKSELESASLLSRVGGFVGLGFFGLDFVIGLVTYRYNVLQRVTLNAGIGYVLIFLAIDLTVLSLMVAAATAGGSIFYDTVLKGIANSSLIRSNLSDRLSEHLKLIIIGGLIAGVITALVL